MRLDSEGMTENSTSDLESNRSTSIPHNQCVHVAGIDLPLYMIEAALATVPSLLPSA